MRQYLLHLARERQLAASTINQAVNAFHFLYERVLHREVAALRQALPFTRKEIHRPQVYSAAELERLFTVGSNRRRRMRKTNWGWGRCF